MVATNLQISLISTSEEKLLTINTLIIQNQVKGSSIYTHFFEDFREVSLSLFTDYNVRSLA